MSPSAKEIIETLYPLLTIAGRYALKIQKSIVAQEDKSGDNIFATALSDADLAVQNMIEVGVLAHFPDVAFYGEEYAASANTKYFSSTKFGDATDLLILLDPIDGTRYYLDGLDFQIVLSVCSPDGFLATIAVLPRRNAVIYALAGEGCFLGSLDSTLADCEPLVLSSQTPPHVLVAMGARIDKSKLGPPIKVTDLTKEYSSGSSPPNMFNYLLGEIDGVVIRSGNLIDSSALVFMALEAGSVASSSDGSPVPQPTEYNEALRCGGIVLAKNQELLRQMLEAVSSNSTT